MPWKLHSSLSFTYIMDVSATAYNRGSEMTDWCQILVRPATCEVPCHVGRPPEKAGTLRTTPNRFNYAGFTERIRIHDSARPGLSPPSKQLGR